MLVVAALIVVGCEKKSPAAGGGAGAPAAGDAGAPAAGGAAAPAAGAAALDPATVANPATISGAVTYSGAPAQVKPIDMSQKPECVALHKDAMPTGESLVVSAGGGLKDVFVQISGGLEKYKFSPPAEPVTLDQKGCMYIPHVFGVMVEQDLKILNSDALLHNVNVKENRPFNIAMNSAGMVENKSKWFKKAQVPTTFQCEVHTWMRAYACVVNHPYHAVTDADGKYSIKGLPAGKYKVKVWHEPVQGGLKAEVEEQEVEVAAGETKTVDFAYKR
jgi:hypothetical protein